MEVHGTVFYESQRPPEVPAFVKNHGLLPQPEFQQLLRKAKVSLAVGTGGAAIPTALPVWTARLALCSRVCTRVVGGRAPLCSQQPGQPPVSIRESAPGALLAGVRCGVRVCGMNGQGPLRAAEVGSDAFRLESPRFPSPAEPAC